LRLVALQVTLASNRYNGWGTAGLAPFENPYVLVTRPALAGRDFVNELKAISGVFRPLVCPAFEIEPSRYNCPPFDEAIFTSKAAVQNSPMGAGRRAWCVGPATAASAQENGYDPVVGPGNATDLVEVILNSESSGRLLHLRGENTHVNVIKTLKQRGFFADEIVIYRKKILQPVSTQIAELENPGPVISPVFSSETVSIIEKWPIDFSKIYFVAISDDVAATATSLSPLKVISAKRPTLPSMLAAISLLIA